MKNIIVNIKNVHPTSEQGFTLIEILLVIAIIGILSAVAIPGYRESMFRGNRVDGKTALLSEASAQESLYSTSGTYQAIGAPGNSSQDGRYLITVASCSAGTLSNCFVATATAQGGQVNDPCGNLTLSSTGLKGTSSGVATDCWRR